MNKILIADDSKLILSLVASFFVGRENEITIITANDGKEAIDKANSEKPDLILMDWQMPGMSGIDALKSLKEDPNTSNIPVVMLTASENTTEAFKFGAIDYIQKPFQKEEFLTRVNNLIDTINAKKSATSAPPSAPTEDLKQMLFEIEVEKDKLKNQKELLIKQKKELSAGASLAQKIHKYFYLNEEIIGKHFNQYFISSVPLFDIPSYALIVNKANNGDILMLFTLFEKKGINAFVLSTSIDKILTNILNQSSEIDTKYILQELCNRTHDLFSGESVYCIICQFDLKNKVLKYSSNGLPVFVHRNHKMVEISLKENEINKFESHKLSLNSGDIIYLLSDGFINTDNYKNKEFVSPGMIEILKKHAEIDFSNQKKEFDAFFQNSKEDLRQQNDMLVIGIKI